MSLLPGAAVLLWLGIMAFFAGVVAPAAFATLDREAAGRFLSAVFPRYYALGAGLGGLALAGLAENVVPGAVSPEALAFARLHRISGLLNAATMLAGVLFLGALGVRR